MILAMHITKVYTSLLHKFYGYGNMDRFLIKRNRNQEPAEEDITDAATAEDSTIQETSAKRKRIFKFGEHWKNSRPWLFTENKKMFCSYCKEFNQSSKNKFVSGCESMRIENVRSHEDSSVHKASHSAYLNSKKSLLEQPIVKAVINMEKHDMELMKKLFTTAFYIGKHEKPFTDFVKLTELQAKNYGDEVTREYYNNDKQAKEFIHFIAKSESETKLENINRSEFIGVAVDGSTDSANLEEESYFVSYLDEAYEPHVDFVKVVSVDGRATAQGLTNCFFDTFVELGIDVKNKCVQLATDGPHVMKNMCKLVRNEIEWLLEFHCANHRLELSFKDAVKQLSLYDDAHSLLNGLYNFYHNSSLQSRTLKGTAELLGIKPLVHTTAKGTRWVAHREKAVSALDRNYSANVAQLQECNQDNTQRMETRGKALGLRDKLLDENLVIFIFAIFKCLLAIFSCLSCILQSDDASIDTVISMIKRTKTKLENFDCEKKIKEFKDTHIKDGIFRDVQPKKNRARHSETSNIVKTQSELLMNNLTQTVIDRFGPLSDGNIGGCPEMSLVSIFDVSRLPDCEGDDISQYGKVEIQQLVCHFSEMLLSKGYDPEQIEEERVPLWEYVRNVLQTTTKDGRSIKKFWPKILRKKGDSVELRNILSLVKILLVLIYSTACVERGFSLMNRVKSDWRSRLNNGSLNDLMHLALSNISVQNFDPEPAIKLWWVNAKMPRRLVDAYGPRPKAQQDAVNDNNGQPHTDSDSE